MDKSHILVPQRADMHRLRRHGGTTGQAILVDLGAGLFSSGAPGSENGGSLGWFPHKYAQVGVQFDRILAWEARSVSRFALWNSIPPAIVPVLSYFNVPCTANPNASHNPWRVLAAVATKADYVVVKIDIDHQHTELALIDQLLSGNSPASHLVDELFWEHHVAGSVVQCPTLWRYGRRA